jgi:chromosome partitioning protein
VTGVTESKDLEVPTGLLEVTDVFDLDRSYRMWRPTILVPKDLPTCRPHPVVVVVNQKGGAGKTTTAVNLGAALAARGMRVRVMDCDPQDGSASDWLQPAVPVTGTLKDIYFDEATLDEVTYPTAYENLYIVPATIELTQVEFARPVGAEAALRNAIAEAEPFDCTIIDCTPSLGTLTVSALGATTEGIVPLRAGGMDMKAVARLNKTIKTVRDKLNPDLRVRAVLITDMQKSNLTRQVIERLAGDFPSAIIAPIRHSVRASEAPFTGQPLRDYAPESHTARDYEQLAPLIVPVEGVA